MFNFVLTFPGTLRLISFSSNRVTCYVSIPEFKPLISGQTEVSFYCYGVPRSELKPFEEHIREFDAKVLAYLTICHNLAECRLDSRTPLASKTKNCALVRWTLGYQDASVATSLQRKIRVRDLHSQSLKIKAAEEDPSKIVWEFWTPTEEDFDLLDPNSPFPVGSLNRTAYYHLHQLYHHRKLIIEEWKAKREGKKDINCSAPLLDINGHMYYVKKAQFPLTYPDFHQRVDPLVMAASRTTLPLASGSSVQVFLFGSFGPGGSDRHANTRRTFRAKLIDPADAASADIVPQQGPATSSSQVAPGGHVQANRQNNARSVAQQHIYSASASRKKGHNPKSGRDKWAELDATNMPLAFPQWLAAFKHVDKNPARVVKGMVDSGYRFPEPALLITPASPQRQKLFCANWLAARGLWISRIDHHPPSPLPVPQTWRDFLNSIPSNLAADNATTRSAQEKLAAKTLFGDGLVHLQGETWAGQDTVLWRRQKIPIATLEDPPAHLMRSILWEIYELSFRYELLALDQAMVPRLWTEAPEVRTELLHSVFHR
ncbi:hypothetical protein BU15DRAFT_77713 [Melanogaster broomeanus]|nr:hypothetical protein BU15DRAFT_77713 [Melanogaster broomeanus]